MVFAVPITASAYNTYVGLKIESVYNPTYGSSEEEHTQWCLPSGFTAMTINDGSEDIDTVTTSSDTCSGDTIWSGLVSLTTEATYNIGLIVENGAFHGLTTKYGYSWTCGAEGSSCTTVCSSITGVSCVDPGSAATEITSDDIQTMCGNPSGYIKDSTSACAPEQSAGWAYEKYLQTSTTAYTCSCTPGYKRVCACGPCLLTYTLTFIAPAE